MTCRDSISKWLRRALIVLLMVPFLAADKTEPAKLSQYASIAELAAQIDAYIKEIETDLGGDAEYGDEQKGRVAKDANTLVVLAQAIGNHDEDHPLKKASPGLITAARDLASKTESREEAKTSFDQLKMALQSSSDEKATWEPVAELAQLMKQVPIVNNKLRLGVGGRRFDRTVEQNAGLAATLVAIAEASQYDTAYCASEEDQKNWAKICQDMRNAAGEVRAAVRKKDQASAQVGLEKLVKTCDDCHHAFRD